MKKKKKNKEEQKHREILPILEFHNLKILNSIINIGGIPSYPGGCHMEWLQRPGWLGRGEGMG